MENNIELYIEKLGSKAPTPGGGGVAALAGALGAALASMVCNLTIGKPKYAQYENELKAVLESAENLSKKMLALAGEDETAFEPLSRAYSLPTETDEQKAYKEKVMEDSLKIAADVPLRAAKGAFDVIVLMERLATRGSKLVISDVGVGVQMARAALLSASLNVKINTKLMKDRFVADILNDEIEYVVNEGVKLADEVYNTVLEMMK
ncbi:MAG: cyclodeaminase/cyclohydrolase family protein [Clostridia bacterium]|nr:cyclodeaminase/cyclohydrolase family protein [Clostridia bacterium]